MADSKPKEFTKKKFERKVAPSKAPLRLLKKKQRDLQRLLQNKDKLKDLPEDVVKDTEAKLKDITAQVAEMSETTQSKAEQENKTKTEKKAADAAAKKSAVNGAKLTGMDRTSFSLFCVVWKQSTSFQWKKKLSVCTDFISFFWQSFFKKK